MSIFEGLGSTLEVIDIFEELGVAYHVGGSFAGSVHGIPRQTNDLDLVADVTLAMAPILEQRLKARFYVDADTIRRAVQSRRSFNLIHYGTGLKIDIFVSGQAAFDRLEMDRSAPYHVDELARSLMEVGGRHRLKKAAMVPTWR